MEVSVDDASAACRIAGNRPDAAAARPRRDVATGRTRRRSAENRRPRRRRSVAHHAAVGARACTWPAERVLPARESRQARDAPRPEERNGPHRARSARARKPRGRRELPPRRDGTARRRLCAALGRQPEARLLRHHRVRRDGSVLAKAGTRHQLSGLRRRARPDRGAERHARYPQYPDCGPARRRVDSGHADPGRTLARGARRRRCVPRCVDDPCDAREQRDRAGDAGGGGARTRQRTPERRRALLQRLSDRR